MAVTWKFKIAQATGLLLWIGVADAADVRVLLYDYAGVSPAVLSSAKANASTILGQAGVRLQWAECRLHEDQAVKDEACRLGVTPLDLQLRILNVAMAKKTGSSRHSLGYAILSDGFDSIAGVFFHRAIDMESRNFASRAEILGAMMGHEIGHLLLEELNHSNTGLMRAFWSDADLKMIAKGQLTFSASQGHLLMSRVAARSDAAEPSTIAAVGR